MKDERWRICCDGRKFSYRFLRIIQPQIPIESDKSDAHRASGSRLSAGNDTPGGGRCRVCDAKIMTTSPADVFSATSGKLCTVITDKAMFVVTVRKPDMDARDGLR